MAVVASFEGSCHPSFTVAEVGTVPFATLVILVRYNQEEIKVGLLFADPFLEDKQVCPSTLLVIIG